MVKLSSLEELMKMYPSFLDKTPSNDENKGSTLYRVNKVKNNQYQDLRTSIKLASYINSLTRPIIINKTQTEPKNYKITTTINIPYIKKIQIHKIDPTTQTEIFNQDNSIYYTKNFTNESETDYYTITLNETCTTTIPIYEYIVTVETYDEIYLVKGYPENDSTNFIHYIKDLTNDDGSITYEIITENLEDETQTNEYEEQYFRFINTYTPSDEYIIQEPSIYVFSKQIEEYTNNGIKQDNWEKETFENETILINNTEYQSYKVPYDEDKVYCIISISSDNYITKSYYPFPYLHDYEIFEHDNQLDVIGAKLNVPRRQYIQVTKPSDLSKTVPSYYNRFDEDDYNYNERIQTYISNYGEKYLPELEIWKQYSLPSILTNRKDLIATQCDTMMWTDCCTDNDTIVKNKTSIMLVTTDLNAYYTVPKNITVRVTCEDNESIYDVLDGFVEYRFNNENHYARVQNGYATLTYTHENQDDWGTIPLQIQYTGYDEYDESNTINTEITFNGKPLTINTNSNNQTATRGDYINLQATVSYKNETIPGIIEFYYHNQLISSSTIEDNKVNIRYRVPNSWNIGLNDITVIYQDTRENPEYCTTSTTFKVNILKEKQKTHISAHLFNPHTFAFHLYDEEHTRIQDRLIYIYEDKKQIGTVKTYSNYFSIYTYNNFPMPST